MEGPTLGSDVTYFSRRAVEGPPRDTLSAHVFWYLDIMDAHLPIIQTFGRYPYRNKAIGRPSTAQEEQSLIITQRFGEVDDAAGARIMKDVNKGVWTPLTISE